MAAYLLLLLAVLSRLALAATPHPEWFNFTAVGGMLLYFGARRSWREMLAPLAMLMATDYLLTVYAYHYSFHWQGYIPTWVWYVAAMALGQILLKARTTFVRVAAGALLGPTSFLPALKLCSLGGRRTCTRATWGDWVHALWRVAVLPQRPDLDCDRGWIGVRVFQCWRGD